MDVTSNSTPTADGHASPDSGRKCLLRFRQADLERWAAELEAWQQADDRSGRAVRAGLQIPPLAGSTAGRERLARLIESAAAADRGCRFVITSQPAAYVAERGSVLLAAVHDTTPLV